MNGSASLFGPWSHTLPYRRITNVGIFDSFNGKAIEKKVAEYSEIYGEILLGFDRDIKAVKSQVERVCQYTQASDLSPQRPVNALSRLLAIERQVEDRTGSIERSLSRQAAQIKELGDECRELQVRICKSSDELRTAIETGLRNAECDRNELRQQFDTHARQNAESEDKIFKQLADLAAANRRLGTLINRVAWSGCAVLLLVVGSEVALWIRG